MWPWGHLAVGYLLYATYTRYRDDEHPAGLAVVALAAGTQLPDLIDKPLAYSWGVLPEGRSFAHSLVFAVPLCLGVLRLARDSTPTRRRAGLAFVLAYGTHLLADAAPDLAAGEAGGLSFLAWPLLAAPDYEATSFRHHVRELVESTAAMSAGSLAGEAAYFGIQFALFGVVVLLWGSHRMPPLPWVVTGIRRRVRSVS